MTPSERLEAARAAHGKAITDWEMNFDTFEDAYPYILETGAELEAAAIEDAHHDCSPAFDDGS